MICDLNYLFQYRSNVDSIQYQMSDSQFRGPLFGIFHLVLVLNLRNTNTGVCIFPGRNTTETTGRTHRTIGGNILPIFPLLRDM